MPIPSRSALARTLSAVLAGAAFHASAGAQALDLSSEVAVVRRHLAAPQAAAALAFVERQIAEPADVIQDWIGVCNAHGPSHDEIFRARHIYKICLLYTSPSPRDGLLSRMPSSA